MLTIENIHKSYGDKVLFHSISCVIRDQEKIGLIGVNGTGKSTLLKIIAGLEQPERGTVKHPKDYHIEYAHQQPVLDDNLTVMEQIYYGESTIMTVMREYEYALLQLQQQPDNQTAQDKLLKMQQKMDEEQAWEANTTAKTILTKLGITDFTSKVGLLSGGQKKRVALAKALLQPADLLLLDEPTNHLDNETIEWLEAYLQSYKGSFILITHDRYFLNRATNRIFELDQGNLYQYEGNYEVFLEKKAEREALEASDEIKHQNTLRRELAWLKRGARARSTKQKARKERIGEMQEKTFHTKRESISLQAGAPRLGKQVVELEEVSKSYGKQNLIDGFSHMILPGDRVGIIGANGTGKTTLLNLLAARISPDAGRVKTGQTVKIGYYTQGEEELDGSMRVIDYIKEQAEVIYTADGNTITAEQMLERFLFSRAEQWNFIRKLSGGERRRLYLLKILMQEPNVLLLDEPTNDLDTQTLSVLEDYLEHFPGVVITVSHDRYFLDRTVDKLFIFAGQGKIDIFYGNYSAFLEQQPDETEKKKEKKTVEKRPPKQKKKLSYHEQKEWNTIEDHIMELEMRIERIQTEITEAGSDSEKVQDLFSEQQSAERELEKKMERWEVLALMVEEMDYKQ
ncbi:ABC-F family ATP-binding cassette domain-containing protein [Virgibacillus kimchii]